MESPNLVALCVIETEAILPYLTRVHRELAGARPPAVPVPERSDRRAGEGEGGPTNSMAGLPRLERRWKGGSPATESSAQKDDGKGAVRARREGVGGVGCFTGGGVGFYRAEARLSVFNDRR
jgi:hypothetical protein